MKKLFILIIGICIFFHTEPVYASSVDEVTRQRDEITEQRDQVQQELNQLNEEADELEDDLSAYRNRYASLQQEVSDAESRIEKNAGDLATLHEELENLRERKNEQYEAMKQRITYMYENAPSSIWEVLFESRSIADFLQQVEYLTAIMTYDRQIMEDYIALEEELLSKEEELHAVEEELNNDLRNTANAREEMAQLVEEAGDALDETNRQANAASQTIEEFNAQIEELRAREREIANANAAALAAQMAAIEQQIENNEIVEENNSAPVNAGEEELILLAATIQAEADGEGYDGRLGVASVIMNRVNSSLFPNSISGVVYQNKQFSCVNFTLPLILARGPNEGCMAVAREALNGNRNTSALFFMTPEAAERLGQSGTPLGNGGHVFFDIWQR